ncbi:MAG: response regulator [Bacteroidales bacterium]|nr:response regulator [Bacteroidales bacterium]
MGSQEETAAKKNQVLIVDDIPSNLNFLSEVLYDEGISVILATNGRDAIEIARQKMPDLILLDIAMPVMDGYEVCARLKEDPVTADIAVIYLTARTEPEDILKGFETGAVDYILKPFNAAELIARVKTHLELKEKSAALKAINTMLEDQVKQRTAELTISNRNLKESNLKLEKTYQELSRLDQAKDEFIRHINHELRTPLQGIHGFTLILEEIVSSPEQKEYIQAINSLVKRLVKLSEITLVFTEIKANNYKISREPVSLYNTAELALELFAKDRDKISVVRDQEDDDITVLADQKLLVICVEQLLDNALKYAPEKGKICLTIRRQKDESCLEITDNGPGFSKKSLEHLYEMFSADNLKYRSHGFGIGLATVKTILDVMEARLEIKNLSQQGALARIAFGKSQSQ